jgi:hypothetical protein
MIYEKIFINFWVKNFDFNLQKDFSWKIKGPKYKQKKYK